MPNPPKLPNPLYIDHVLGLDFPGLHLDEEIGSPGQYPRLTAVGTQEVQDLGD